MSVGHLLLILAMLRGITAYRAAPSAQQHVPYVNRDYIVDFYPNAHRKVDDLNYYRHQQAPERKAQQGHRYGTRYDIGGSSHEDYFPKSVFYEQNFDYEDEFDDYYGPRGSEDIDYDKPISIFDNIAKIGKIWKDNLRREKMEERNKRIKENERLFKKIGKRSIRQEVPPRPAKVNNE